LQQILAQKFLIFENVFKKRWQSKKIPLSGSPHFAEARPLNLVLIVIYSYDFPFITLSVGNKMQRHSPLPNVRLAPSFFSWVGSKSPNSSDVNNVSPLQIFNGFPPMANSSMCVYVYPDDLSSIMSSKSYSLLSKLYYQIMSILPRVYCIAIDVTVSHIICDIVICYIVILLLNR